MSAAAFAPPIKCQGIKTKLVGDIARFAQSSNFERWVEPFCGSCVVPLNIQPRRAVLSDSNIHIIQFYRDIQSRRLTAGLIREFLHDEGEKLRGAGETHYYRVRERFNSAPRLARFSLSKQVMLQRSDALQPARQVQRAVLPQERAFCSRLHHEDYESGEKN